MRTMVFDATEELAATCSFGSSKRTNRQIVIHLPNTSIDQRSLTLREVRDLFKIAI